MNRISQTQRNSRQRRRQKHSQRLQRQYNFKGSTRAIFSVLAMVAVLYAVYVGVGSLVSLIADVLFA